MKTFISPILLLVKHTLISLDVRFPAFVSSSELTARHVEATVDEGRLVLLP